MLDPRQRYLQRIERAVGERDPIEVLETSPIAAHQLVADTPVDILRARPFPKKWTPLEVLGHLVDAEFVFGVRLRLMLTEVEPLLPNWNQDVTVERQRFNERNPGTLSVQFLLLRRANLPLWKSLTPADMERGGRHITRGRETIGEMLRITAGHDLLHLEQMERSIAAARADRLGT